MSCSCNGKLADAAGVAAYQALKDAKSLTFMERTTNNLDVAGTGFGAGIACTMLFNKISKKSKKSKKGKR